MKSSQPTLARSHWEWKICVAVWTLAAAWTLIVSWFLGYLGPALGEGEALPSIILGMPAWVFWGIFCPWVAVTLVTMGLGLRMQDDDSTAQPSNSPSQNRARGPEHV